METVHDVYKYIILVLSARFINIEFNQLVGGARMSTMIVQGMLLPI